MTSFQEQIDRLSKGLEFVIYSDDYKKPFGLGADTTIITFYTGIVIIAGM